MESNEQGRSSDLGDRAWLAFPGGELEGKRPKVLCPLCRKKCRGSLDAPESRGGPICFQCYRAALDRDRTIAAAGRLQTASEARFQSLLPFEPVNQPRLAMLRAERGVERAALQAGDDRFAEKRRQAQIAARGALDRGPTPEPGTVAPGGPTPRAAPWQVLARPAKVASPARTERERLFLAAIHAAELQWPESWLPFVVAL